MEWTDGLTWRAETVVFAMVAAVSLALLLVAMVVDSFGDVDIPFFGDAHFGDISGDGIQLVNSQSMLAFLATYGAAGWAVSGYGHVWVVWSALAGLAPGAVVGLIAAVVFNFFKRSETSTAFSLKDAVGETGVVNLEVAPGTTGKVVFRRGIEEHTAPAIPHGAVTIPIGGRVKIVAAEGGTLVVVPREDLSRN